MLLVINSLIKMPKGMSVSKLNLRSTHWMSKTGCCCSLIEAAVVAAVVVTPFVAVMSQN